MGNVTNSLDRIFSKSQAESAPVVAVDERLSLYDVALTDEDIVKALHSLAIDTFPSKYGFPETQVSGTNVPSIRRIVARCNRIIAEKEHPSAAAISAPEVRPTDDALWDQTIRDRDTYHDWADKLAEAIAKRFGVDIGEHSNANLPWAEALDAIEAAAGVPHVERDAALIEAVGRLVKAKGRFHTEQNYAAVVAAYDAAIAAQGDQTKESSNG